MNADAQAALCFLPEADFEALARLELDQERSLLLEADSVAFIHAGEETRFQLDRSLAVQLSRADDKLLVELRQRSSGGWQRQRLLAPFPGIDGLAPSYAGNADGRLWAVDTQTMRRLLARLRASMQLEGGENWLLPTPAPKSSFEKRLERLQRAAQPTATGLHFQPRDGLVELRRRVVPVGAVLSSFMTMGALFFFLVVLLNSQPGYEKGLLFFGLVAAFLGGCSAWLWRASRNKVLFGLKAGQASGIWNDGAIISSVPLPSPLRVLGVSTQELQHFPSPFDLSYQGSSARTSRWSVVLHLEEPEEKRLRQVSLFNTGYSSEADWLTQVLACWFVVDPVSTELSSERHRWPLLEDEEEQSLLSGLSQEQKISIRSAEGGLLEVDRRALDSVEFGSDDDSLRILLRARDGRWRRLYAYLRSEVTASGQLETRARKEPGVRLELPEMLRLYAHLGSLRPAPCRFDPAWVPAEAQVRASVRQGELHLVWSGSRALGFGLLLLALALNLLFLIAFLKEGSLLLFGVGLPALLGSILVSVVSQAHWVADRNTLWRQLRRRRRLLLSSPRAAWLEDAPGFFSRKRLVLDAFISRCGSSTMAAAQAETILLLLSEWFGFSKPELFEDNGARTGAKASLSELSEAQDLFSPMLDD